MKTLLHTASRGAMVALLAATPVLAYAQSDTNAEQDPLKQTPSAEATASTQADGTSTDITADVKAGNVATDDPATAATDKTVPAEGGADVATDDGAVTDPTAPQVADDTMAPAQGEQMAAEEPAKPVEGQITMQDDNTILVDDLLGATVYNASDENVGDINDLIIGLDGSVKGVVIGVGGFLGMGEREVAIEMAALDVVDPDGDPRLVTSATRADLENAPEFVSAADQRAKEQSAAPAGDSMGGVMGGTAQPTE